MAGPHQARTHTLHSVGHRVHIQFARHRQQSGWLLTTSSHSSSYTTSKSGSHPAAADRCFGWTSTCRPLKHESENGPHLPPCRLDRNNHRRNSCLGRSAAPNSAMQSGLVSILIGILQEFGCTALPRLPGGTRCEVSANSSHRLRRFSFGIQHHEMGEQPLLKGLNAAPVPASGPAVCHQFSRSAADLAKRASKVCLRRFSSAFWNWLCLISCCSSSGEMGRWRSRPGVSFPLSSATGPPPADIQPPVGLAGLALNLLICGTTLQKVYHFIDTRYRDSLPA